MARWPDGEIARSCEGRALCRGIGAPAKLLPAGKNFLSKRARAAICGAENADPRLEEEVHFCGQLCCDMGEAVIRIQVLDLRSAPRFIPHALADSIRRKINLPAQPPSLLLSQDAAVATLAARVAQREHIPLDICADLAAAVDLIPRKPYRAMVVDFELMDSCEVLIGLGGPSHKPVGLALLPPAANLSEVFAAGFTLAIPKPLSMQPLRMALKAAYGCIPWARRGFPRAGIRMPALVGTARDGVVRGSILNLSEKGACLALEQKVPSGRCMTMRFALAGGKEIDVGATVIWELPGRLGVEFLRVPCRHRAGIRALVWAGLPPAANASTTAR